MQAWETTLLDLLPNTRSEMGSSQSFCITSVLQMVIVREPLQTSLLQQDCITDLSITRDRHKQNGQSPPLCVLRQPNLNLSHHRPNICIHHS
eukprot:scaffold538_cov118-Skeletonema_dohrnii-CCMP3373.AAC.1